MKDAILVVIIVFTAALSFIFGAIWEQRQNFKKGRQPTCQSEFNQQVKSTSIEHGQDIPHKGKRLNRIVIECEGNKQ